jgi:hypothetical protein
VRDAACPLSTRGGGAEVTRALLRHALERARERGREPRLPAEVRQADHQVRDTLRRKGPRDRRGARLQRAEHLRRRGRAHPRDRRDRDGNGVRVALRRLGCERALHGREEARHGARLQVKVGQAVEELRGVARAEVRGSLRRAPYEQVREAEVVRTARRERPERVQNARDAARREVLRTLTREEDEVRENAVLHGARLCSVRTVHVHPRQRTPESSEVDSVEPPAVPRNDVCEISDPLAPGYVHGQLPPVEFQPARGKEFLSRRQLRRAQRFPPVDFPARYGRALVITLRAATPIRTAQ